METVPEKRHAGMSKDRMAAFSDGVFAIIITIMVLELKVPAGPGWSDITKLIPVFLSYVLSFLYVGIYWNNHHHLLATCERVNGKILWANMHLLFWLSLMPFATAWMENNHFAPLPAALYGVVLFLSAIAYLLLQFTIVRSHGPRSLLAEALGSDWKGKGSLALYIAAIGFAFLAPLISVAIYVVVAFIWVVPDLRIERAMHR